MKYVFKQELDNIELEKVSKYCNSVDYCSLEQLAGFSQILYKTRINYFYIIDDNIIKSFCQINESYRSAQIIFGPVCCDKDLIIISINKIIEYYKEKRFYYLGIQMYFKSSYEADYIEYALNRDHSITYKYDNENTKSSIEIDLKESIEEIYGRMRKGHRSDIKRALRSGLTVHLLKDNNELAQFTVAYIKMCRARKIAGHSSNELAGISEYLLKNKKGQILLVKDTDQVVLGGMFLAYQGISVRYLLGAADPDKRDLPILHLAIYEAIANAKKEGFRYFDFWGYNHFAKPNDQVYFLNHFKKGFGGYFTFFAKKMNINLFPYGYKMYRVLVKIKKLGR